MSSFLKTPLSHKTLLNKCVLCLFLLIFITYFWHKVSLCHPDWSAVTQTRLTCSLDSQAQPIFSSHPKIAEITGTCHHIRLIFVFLVEIGFIMLARLVSNSWLKWSTHLSLPKCWDYWCEPPHLAKKKYSLHDTGMGLGDCCHTVTTTGMGRGNRK